MKYERNPAESADADGTAQVSTRAGKSQLQSLLNSRKMIFLMLFGVTGFLGLPLLWLSPVFSASEKMVWSVINTIYTLILIALCAMVCYWSYMQIRQAVAFL